MISELVIFDIWNCFLLYAEINGVFTAYVCDGASTVKSPLITMARPKFAPKSTPSSGPIAKPQYLPYPWACPTYGAKRHPDPMCRFSTMHWCATHRHTYRPTERSRESSMTIVRFAQRATRPNNVKE